MQHVCKGHEPGAERAGGVCGAGRGRPLQRAAAVHAGGSAGLGREGKQRAGAQCRQKPALPLAVQPHHHQPGSGGCAQDRPCVRPAFTGGPAGRPGRSARARAASGLFGGTGPGWHAAPCDRRAAHGAGGCDPGRDRTVPSGRECRRSCRGCRPDRLPGPHGQRRGAASLRGRSHHPGRPLRL